MGPYVIGIQFNCLQQMKVPILDRAIRLIVGGPLFMIRRHVILEPG